MAIVYLSLGSNLGDRVGYIQQATSLLSANDKIRIIATSSFYETEPWGVTTPNWFVNAIVQIATTLSPKELLDECQKIESLLGRKRYPEAQYSDRTVDIDIIFYDDRIEQHTDKQILVYKWDLVKDVHETKKYIYFGGN